MRTVIVRTVLQPTYETTIKHRAGPAWAESIDWLTPTRQKCATKSKLILTNRIGRFPDGGGAGDLVAAQPIRYVADYNADDKHEQMRQ